MWQEADTWALLGIQSLLRSELADFLLPILRDKYTWFPLYAVLIGWMVYRYKRMAFLLIPFAFAAVGVSDFLSSGVLKELIGRPRPCQTPELAESLRVLVRCSPHFGMPSSHAANHFTLSSFLIFAGVVQRPVFKSIWWLWAAVIALSQVYVGVHFPADVLAGALLGVFLGRIFAHLYLNLSGKKFI